MAMNKHAVVYILAILGAICLSVFAGMLSQPPQYPAVARDFLDLQVQAVTKNNDCYNVSLSVKNVGPSSAIINNFQTVQLSSIPYENITNARVYCGGTQVCGGANSIRYDLGCNGTLQVNFIIPASEYIPRTTAVLVYTNHELFCTDAEVW
jgi:hypothetical protein